MTPREEIAEVREEALLRGVENLEDEEEGTRRAAAAQPETTTLGRSNACVMVVFFRVCSFWWCERGKPFFAARGVGGVCSFGAHVRRVDGKKERTTQHFLLLFLALFRFSRRFRAIIKV